MKVEVKIIGVKDFGDACKKMAAQNKKSLGAILLDAATMTHKFAIELITTGARSGITYFKTKQKISHVASAPGEPPKSDMGTLVQNITIEKIGEKGADGYTVGSRKGAPHGFFLEFGTSKMLPRPWLSVALQKMQQAMKGKYNG